MEQLESYREIPSLKELGLEKLGITTGREKITLCGPDGTQYEASSFLIQPRDEDTLKTNYLTLGLWKVEEGIRKPIGHVDFLLEEKEKVAYAEVTPFSLIEDDFPSPTKFKELITRFRNINGQRDTVALRILPEDQGKKLGPLLWALGLGTLELLDYKICRLRGDFTPKFKRLYGYSTTDSKQPATPGEDFFGRYSEKVYSFFQRYGARPHKYHAKSLDFKRKALIPKELDELITLTHLTVEQEAIIKGFLKNPGKTEED